MIPFLGPMIGTFLTGRSLKLGLIAAAVLAVFGCGVYAGYRWQAGNVADAVARMEKAEADYLQLRQEVAAAMTAAQEQAITIEAEHAKRAEQDREEYYRLATAADERIADVLKRARRVPKPAEGGGQVCPSPVPESQDQRCIDGAAAFERLTRRVGDCAKAEARLKGLQQSLRAQGVEVVD